MIRLGGKGTSQRVPPVPDGHLDSEHASVIGEGIRRMVEARFPIEVVMAYLHTSADASDRETEIAMLLLAIYCIAEAWVRLPTGARGKINAAQYIIRDPAKFEFIRDILVLIVGPILWFVKAPSDLVSRILSSIKSANNTGTKQRLRAVFKDLGVDEGDGAYALEYRNKLFHNGYVVRSPDLLERKELQRHYDAAPRLRNLVNAMILSLCGYTGLSVEFARNRTFPVVAKPSPFNDVADF